METYDQMIQREIAEEAEAFAEYQRMLTELHAHINKHRIWRYGDGAGGQCIIDFTDGLDVPHQSDMHYDAPATGAYRRTEPAYT